MKNRIRVTLQSLFVKKDGRFWGKAQWVLDTKVGGSTLGDPAQRFTVTDGQTVTFAPNKWSAIVEVDAASRIVVSFHAKEVGSWFDDDFGSVSHTLKWPFQQLTVIKENKYYKVKFEVLLEARKAFKVHDPREAFACRGTADNPEVTTVSGTKHRVRFEACEVLPSPPDAYLPARIGGGVTGTAPFSATTGVTLTDTDPINVLPNPAVIPVLAVADAKADTAARIRITYYEPTDLHMADDDKRMEWKIDSLDGAGAAAFLGAKTGMSVLVYGTAAGEVQLTASFLGAPVAKYRALVRGMKKVACRVNLAKGGAGFETTSTAADVKKHLHAANCILRQVGLALELDSSDKVSDGGKKLETGIFELKLSVALRGRAINVKSKLPRIARMNYRPKVLNLVYVVSMEKASVLGEAVMMPFNKSPKPVGGAFPQITDSGTPSTSWISPSGVHPHAAATTQTLEMMQESLHPSHKNCWAVTVTNGNTSMLQIANTMAHEVGHALGLAHREGTQDLLPELNQNLMHATEGPMVAQDMDIVQARAVVNSPLVT